MNNKLLRKGVLYAACITLTAGSLQISAASVFAANAVLDIGEGDYILPYSDVQYYTENDIKDMTAEQLRYARNEIFARYGRKFKSAELQSYFNSKSWYYPVYEPDDFSEDSVNEVEKANVRLLQKREIELKNVGSSAAPNEGFTKNMITEIAAISSSVFLDMDNNGSNETIYVEPENTVQYGNPYDEYTLHIGNSAFSGYGENIDQKIYALSLNGSNFIVIYAYGPSDDPNCTFYGYKNGEVYYAGEIETAVSGIKIDDRGVMHAATRCYVLQADAIEASWIVDSYGDIVEESRSKFTFKSYLRGKDYQLLETIMVYDEPNYSSSSSYLYPQDSVSIPYTDGSMEWVYIETASGEGGWCNCDELGNYSERMNIIGGLMFAG